MYPFEDEKLYRTDDPDLRVLASKGTMAKWRCMGTGPRYIRFGGRIFYKGKDLNDCLEQHYVETTGDLPGTG